MAEWTCPRCTGPNPENAGTCLSCGAVYHAAAGEGPAPAQPSAPAIPEGWSRFVDGWNGFSLGLEPDDAGAVLSSVRELRELRQGEKQLRGIRVICG